jgi:hypothetical protein
MDTTPNTLNFMYMGYSVIFGVGALYLISLWVRFRSLRQDEKALDELEKKE